MRITQEKKKKTKQKNTFNITLIKFSTFLAEIVSINTLISTELNKKKIMGFGNMVTADQICSINVKLYSFFHLKFLGHDKNPNSFQVLCF